MERSVPRGDEGGVNLKADFQIPVAMCGEARMYAKGHVCTNGVYTLKSAFVRKYVYTQKCACASKSAGR